MSLSKILRVSHICSFVLLAMWSSQGRAQVVQDDAVLVNTTGELLAILNQGLPKRLLLVALTTLAVFNFFGIAEFYALYFASPSDEITPGFVTSTDPFASNFPPLPGVTTLTLPVGESVYFGYWDDRTIFSSDPLGSDSTPDFDDNFGWLELSRSARLDGTFGQLEILGGNCDWAGNRCRHDNHGCYP